VLADPKLAPVVSSRVTATDLVPSETVKAAVSDAARPVKVVPSISAAPAAAAVTPKSLIRLISTAVAPTEPPVKDIFLSSALTSSEAGIVYDAVWNDLF